MIYPFVLPLYRRTDSKLGHFILLKRLEDASESERAWSGICIAKTIVTVEIARPDNNDSIIRTLCLTKEEKEISYLIETDDWLEL